MGNVIIEFIELFQNRLSDILFKEANNERYMYLYDTGSYWMAFEKSAYMLSRLYANALLFPMKIPYIPYPIVTASIEQARLHTIIKGLVCKKRTIKERIYVTGEMNNLLSYNKWHDRETEVLRTLPSTSIC